MRTEAEDRSRMLADHVYQEVDDPKHTLVPPKALDPVPYLNLTPLRNANAALRKSADAYEKAYAAAIAGGNALPAGTADKLNSILLKTERALTRPAGLPRRSWFQHQIYAPGFYTGYGVKTIAPVREALEQRNWKEAEEQAVLVADTLQGFARELDRATALLPPAK